MERFCKAVAVVTVLCLASGVPDVLGGLRSSGIPMYACVVYLVCSVAGLLGAVCLFAKRPRLARGLLLWGIGPASLVYETHQYAIAFPTYFHLPVTFGGGYPTGEFYHFGIDLLPGSLFITIWIAYRKLVAPSAGSAR